MERSFNNGNPCVISSRPFFGTSQLPDSISSHLFHLCINSQVLTVMAKKVLLVCTSAEKFGSLDSATGAWMEELAAPFWTFKKHGYEVTVASIKGGEIPMDESSLNPPFLTPDAEKFVLDDACMELVTKSVKLGDVNVAEYDAAFCVGGHGTCFDFPNNATLGKVLAGMYDAGKVVAAVCHGPNAFVGANSAVTGEPIIKGKKITGFSNSEEQAVGKDDVVPFLLEDKLKELGGLYEKADSLWAPFAVRDGNLVTGQNPSSSHRAAELVVEAMSA